jgi:ABC-type multidrug transport system, ATPase and permease components
VIKGENKAQDKQEEKLEPKEEALLKNFKQNENNTLRTLIGLYKGHYLNLLISIIFFILKSSPVWILPIVTSNIINAATNKDENAIHTILINIVIILVTVFQNVITNYIHTVLYAKTIRSVERNLRSSLVKKLQQLSIAYHNEMQSGRLQSKIMRDVEQIQILSSQVFITILGIGLNIIVALGVIIFKNFTVFLFFAATIPVAVIIIAVFSGKIKRYNSDYRKEMEETSVRVMEMVELIPVTRAHALERQETKKTDEQLKNVAKKGLKLDLIQAYFSSINWASFQIFQIICLGFTGYLAVKNYITVGEVVLYQTYFGGIIAEISAAITLLPTIAKGLESVNSVGDILLCHDIENNRKKNKIKDVTGTIVFNNVDFQYKESGVPILKNLNFTINPGETIAFVGASGAGKSTILNLVIGFFQSTGGEVLIDNQDIKSLNLQSYRSYIGVVPQNPILFSDTIRENIIYGTNDISDEELTKIVKAANLEELIKSLPEGLDTKITEHGRNLSGGQRQRISIARAFVRNPKILILDEATSALDSVSEKKIQESIENLVKDRTTLVVAHRLSTIRNADKIAVIGNGGLQEFGTYDELMEKKGEFYKLKQLQM